MSNPNPYNVSNICLPCAVASQPHRQQTIRLIELLTDPANEMIVCDTVTSVIDLEIEKSKLWDSIWECPKLMRRGTWESGRMRKCRSRVPPRVQPDRPVPPSLEGAGHSSPGRSLLKLGVNMRGQPTAAAAAGIKYFQFLTGNTNIWYSECVLQMWPEKI